MSDQKIVLTSNDGVSIEVGMSPRYRSLRTHEADLTFADRVVAERSMLIKNMMEDLGDDAVGAQAVPIPNVSSAPHFGSSV